MRIQFLFFISLFSIGTMYLSAQFTETRKKRGPSMSNLKESCCKECGDVLLQSSELLGAIGSLQKRAISAIEAYANGDKSGWCATASRENLTQCNAKLANIQKEMRTLIKECNDLISEMDPAS